MSAATVLALVPLLWARPAALSPETLIAQGKALAAKNNYSAAVPFLQGAVALSGQKPEVVLELADVLKSAGQYDEAVSEYERFLKRAPKDHPKAAYAEAEAERLVDAPRPFDADVFRLTPADREARLAFAMGSKHIKANEHEKALAALEAAASLNPDLPGPYRLIGALYGKLKQPEKEKEFLLRYLRIRPEGARVPEIRERLTTLKVLGKLTVTTSFPSEAFINGRPIGSTPFKEPFLLPEGRYTLSVRCAKYYFIKNVPVKVEPGQAVAKDVRFGVVQMKLDPWARVKVGGKDLGLWEEFALPAGEHTLELRSGDGTREKTVPLAVKGGETIVLSQW